MLYVFLIVLIPLLVTGLAKVVLKKTINWQEWAISFTIAAAIGLAIFYSGRFSEAADVEVWNGQVVGKQRERVSCEHSYECNCTQSCSGSGTKRSCTTTCQTCYEHAYDIDWRVATSAGDFTVSRIDRQGLRQPPRWEAVQIGEPASREHPYTNWVKAVPESLFNDHEADAAAYAERVPEYPEVYDYQRIDRVLGVFTDGGPDAAVASAIDTRLDEALATLGPQRQMNALVIFTDIKDPGFAYAVRNSWKGGKKNDAIVIMGVPVWPEIAWVHVHSWSKNEMFNVSLRDALLDQGTVTTEGVVDAIEQAGWDHFERRPMAEFEYLKDEIEPPLWVVVVAALAALLIGLGTTWFFHRNDVRIFGR